MVHGGYGFNEVWQNLPHWIDELDIDAVKKDAGIKTGTEQGSQRDGTKRASR